MNSPIDYFFEIPLITRMYLSTCFLVAILVQARYLTQYHLYFNPHLVFYRGQWWRLLTCFLYFGPIGVEFILNMIYTSRYWSIEVEEFRGKKSEFVFMLLFGMAGLLPLGALLNEPFLAEALNYVVIYVWSRRNSSYNIALLGLFPLSAPYLPFALFMFQWLLTGRIPILVGLGILVGHTYYYFKYIYPIRNNKQFFQVPWILKRIFGEVSAAPPSRRIHTLSDYSQ